MADETTLQGVLDQLVHAAAEAPPTCWARAVLASAVTDLEQVAGASLGAADQDSMVMLQRRLGRVHRLLTGAPGSPGSPGASRIRAHLEALRCPPTTASALVSDVPHEPALAHAV